MTQSKETFGTILAFIAAIISGFSIFANKIFIVTLNPLIFTATRAILLGGIFFLLSLYKSKWSFKGFKKVSWKYLIAIGVIGGGFAFLLFFSGLKITTSGRAAFLQKTLPFYVTLLAFFFLKEKIGKKQITALLLMFMGTIIISSAGITPAELWSYPEFGDAFIISATILWAIENIISRKAMILGENNFVVSFGRMFFGALILFGMILLANKFELLFYLTQTEWMYILISSVILFAYVLTYYWSMKYVNVSKTSTILLFSPVITLILGVYFLNEPAPIFQVAGSAIILFGACLISNIKSKFSGI